MLTIHELAISCCSERYKNDLFEGCRKTHACCYKQLSLNRWERLSLGPKYYKLFLNETFCKCGIGRGGRLGWPAVLPHQTDVDFVYVFVLMVVIDINVQVYK